MGVKQIDIREYISDMAKKAKEASRVIRTLKAERKNRALLKISELINERRSDIINANRIDYENGKAAGLSEAFLDRLLLTEKRIDDMVTSLQEIAALEDPVGEIVGVRRPQGFVLEKVRVPIGVIAMIYESRPNVTVDAAALCLKSGNAVILRGGKESIESNLTLAGIIREALAMSDIPQDVVQYVARKEHEGISWLVKQSGYIDLVIPRGGEGLIKRVVEDATIPVIKHYKGVCHLYIDREADLDMALEVVYNAKVQRPGTCNALETLLVHEDISDRFLPLVRNKLSNVELRGCEKTLEIIRNGVTRATEEDYYTEYHDLILSVKVVSGVEEAVQHIAKYGSEHTDGIISKNLQTVEYFVQNVDSAVVTVNASTRLSDGGVFGLGAEIGISTDKLHARGPMGIKELTTYKWVLRGEGHIRE